MKKPNIKLVILLGMLLGLFFAFASAAEGPDKTKRVDKQQALTKTTGTPIYQVLNINNIRTWARADGSSNHSPQGDDGGYYPRGAKWVIYQDGFVWGGKAYLNAALTQPHASQLIRVGGGTYNQGTREGAIVGTGAAAVPENRLLDLVRILKIRRDYFSISDVELTRDAADFYEVGTSDVTEAQKAAVKALYDKDWKDWPVAKGAPYIERNGTPGYQAPPAFSATMTVADLIGKKYDEPGFAGGDPNSPADQVIWTVYNDLEPAAVQGFSGSEPLGLEVQMTLWGYKRTDAMGNLYFKRFRFINKGGVTTAGTTKGSFWIDSMYVAQWSDPDVGSFGDDLAGCDTTLSLGFAYNGNAVDAEFRKFNLAPPAVGYDFLQGPLVRGAATDVGIFDMKKRTGFKNLPMTSFAYFSAGSGISDPPFSYEGALRWWRMLQGFVPDASTAAWRLYPFPPGMTANKFPLSGDAAKRTGFIDGLGLAYSLAPGDRRIVLNSGPFTLAPGDTQEVVVGTVAGLGSDRLSSVAVMKFNDRFVQLTYDALFQVAKSPATPDVKIAELDGEIILEWGSNPTRVGQTETIVNQPGSYRFEGYNVYQLPSATSRLSEAKRIATFDLATDPAVVLDEQFEQTSGQILFLPVQFGTNSGIQRYLRVNRDYVRDIDKLNNGQEYYYAVTAYSIATVPGFLPAALESDPLVYTIRPQSPSLGTRFPSKFGDVVTTTKTAGNADASVSITVVDPKQVTGNQYDIRLAIVDTLTIAGVTFPRPGWSLFNKTTGRTVLTTSTTYGFSPDNRIAEGLQVGVDGAPVWTPGKEIAYTAYAKAGTSISGITDMTASNWSGVNWGGSTFGGGLDVGANFFGSTLAPHRVTKTVEIRFTAAGGGQKAYNFIRQATGGSTGSPYAGFHTQPFTVWDITNAASPRQIDFLIMEQFDQPTRDNIWAPGVAAGNREYFYIIDDTYTATEKAEYVGKTLAYSASKPVLYAGWFVLKDGTKPAYANGDVWRIKATNLLTPADLWTFNTASLKATFDAELASKDAASKIGVFPNPYYAFNAGETNRLVRFVTFNNLPQVATVRIFNLAGHLVRTLRKDDASQFLRWDLTNENNFPVASGMYIAHIELTLPGGENSTKVLKLGIIQEQEVLDVF